MSVFGSRTIDESPDLRGVACVLCFYHLLSWVFWAQNSGLGLEAWREGSYLPMHPAMAAFLWLPFQQAQMLMRLLAWLSLWAGYRFASAERTGSACLALAVLTAAKLYFYLHDLREVANFHHMHLFFCALLLVARQKREWLRLGLSAVYWMAALVKFSPSWTRGEYFSSVPAGLPWLPHDPTVITLACWGLILLELIGPFFLLIPRTRRRAVLVFMAFHLYSGLIVGYWYTSLMLPLLWFIHAEGETRRLPWETAPAFLCGTAFLLNIWHWTIPGDVRLTGEGRYLGLFMFDCNRRADARLEVVKGRKHFWFETSYTWPKREVGDFRSDCRLWVRDGDGPWRQLSYGLVVDEGAVLFQPRLLLRLNGRILNDPYVYYCWARFLQARYHPDRISLRLWTQIDRHEETYEVMRVDDFQRECRFYTPLAHNAWVRLP